MVHSSYAAALIWTAVVYQLMVLSSAQNNAPGYLGCFDNSWIGGWSLKGVSTTYYSLSVERCFKYCLNINAYKYAGVVSGTICYCGSNEDYGRLGREADAECRRYTCPGNSNQYCGGDRRIAIYQISKGVCNNAIGPPGQGSHYVTNPTHVYSNLDNSKLFGTRVRFECDTGYVIQGADTIECTQIGNDAEWSNSVPTCIGTGDTVPPDVTFCPGDSTYFAPFQSSGRTLTWTEPTVVDNSGAFHTTQARISGSFFTVGDSQVTYTFTDAAGNQATCTFLVRVIQQEDSTPPVVTHCPENIVVSVPFQSTGATISWNKPIATDNSGALTTTSTRTSGDLFAANTHSNVIYTFRDAANNYAFCTFTVTINELGDTVPPTVTFCPVDSTYFAPFRSSGTTVTWTEPTVVDNSGAFGATQTRTSGSFFTVGDSQVTYTFTDAAGNQATCTFLVRVIQQGDSTPPVVTHCPDNIVVSVPFQSNGTTLGWNEPIATDNSGALTTTSNHSSGDFFAANTQTTVIYNFRDAANNNAFCTFRVTINELGDNTQPVVTLCPENIVFPVSFQSTGTTLSWTEPIATDNSGALTTTSTRTSGDFFAANTQTNVTYTFTDAANNQAVCTFTVTINELAPSLLPTTMNQTNNTSNATNSTTVNTSSGVPSRTIIGTVAGVIAALVILLVIAIVTFRRRGNKRNASSDVAMVDVTSSTNQRQGDFDFTTAPNQASTIPVYSQVIRNQTKNENANPDGFTNSEGNATHVVNLDVRPSSNEHDNGTGMVDNILYESFSLKDQSEMKTHDLNEEHAGELTTMEGQSGWVENIIYE